MGRRCRGRPADEFVASITEDGIRDPIEVIPLADGPANNAGNLESTDGNTRRPRFTIVDGHRRYFAGLTAGVEDAPVYLSASHADDRASQYLTMFTSSRHTAKLTPIEEANALFAAHRAGASQTTIRKKTGLPRDEVKTALKAGSLDNETLTKAANNGYDLTLDQYALLKEFEDDAAIVDETLRNIKDGGSGQHAAERVRQRRAITGRGRPRPRTTVAVPFVLEKDLAAAVTAPYPKASRSASARSTD